MAIQHLTSLNLHLFLIHRINKNKNNKNNKNMTWVHMSDSFNLKSIFQDEIREKRLQREKEKLNNNNKHAKISSSNDINQDINKDISDNESKSNDQPVDSEDEFLDKSLSALSLPIRLSESESKKDRFKRLKKASKFTFFTKSSPDELVDPMDTELITTSLLVNDQVKTKRLITLFIKRLLNKWKNDLNNNENNKEDDTEDRKSFSREQYYTCCNLLESLFKLLKSTDDGSEKESSSSSLSMELLTCITTICFYMQKREYLKANDMYLRLTIGNATWPIGISMLGIKKEKEKEKEKENPSTPVSTSTSSSTPLITPSISSIIQGKREDTKKGMLVDESTRKWIQSLKRLISYCQIVYPPLDSFQTMG